MSRSGQMDFVFPCDPARCHRGLSRADYDGAEALVESLMQHGVERVFGYPGGANIPIFDAI